MNKLIRISILLFLSTTLFLQSCKKDDSDDNTTTSTTPYFTFAKVGNITNYTTAISIMGQTFNGTAEQKITAKYNNNVYQMITTMDLGLSQFGIDPTTDTSYWFVNNTSFGSCDDQNGTNTLLYYTKGDAVNKTYSQTVDGVTTVRTVASLNQSISSPLGSFPTINIVESTDDGSNDVNYFFHKDAGMIKMATIMSSQVGDANVEILIKSKNF